MNDNGLAKTLNFDEFAEFDYEFLYFFSVSYISGVAGMQINAGQYPPVLSFFVNFLGVFRHGNCILAKTALISKIAP